MTHYPPEALAATRRAARSVADYRANAEGWSRPVQEARREGIDAMEQLTLALIAMAADLADTKHGQRAQRELDRHALNASAFEERQHRERDR